MNNEICSYLDYLFPTPVCELVYNSDYELLIAVVLSAQTTGKRVNSVTKVLFNKYNSLSLLKQASLVDLENILHPLGSFRKKAQYVKEIARILDEEYFDVVPRDRDKLIKFPGVGRKTINVFLSEFYNEQFIAVDTHVERVSKRLGIARKNDNVFDVEMKIMKKFKGYDFRRLHLQLVLFGRYYCKAIKPICNNCLLVDYCIEKRKNLD